MKATYANVAIDGMVTHGLFVRVIDSEAPYDAAKVPNLARFIDLAQGKLWSCK